MAVVTQVIAAFNNDEVVFSMDITTSDFATGNVTGFRATSRASAAQSYGEIFLSDGSRKNAQTCLPGTDTSVAIGTGAVVRLPVTFDSRRNRWVGIRGNFLGPSAPAAVKGAFSSAPEIVRQSYE